MTELIEQSYQTMYKEVNQLEISYTLKNPLSNPMLNKLMIMNEFTSLFSVLNRVLIVLEQPKLDINQFSTALNEQTLSYEKMVSVVFEGIKLFEEKKGLCIKLLNNKFESLRMI